MMKVVFMGTPDFAAETLKAIISSEHTCLAVFTQPDKPKGRGKKVQMSQVKELALDHDLPVYQPQNLHDGEALAILEEIGAEAIIVAAYGKILPESILSLPKYGCINVHASVLPKYRGAAPIHWAIINGEKETGITIMQMDAGMDTGDILQIQKTEISHAITTGDLYQRLAKMGGELLSDTLTKLEKGEITPLKQIDDDATYAPLLTKEHEKINWENSAADIYNTIRGMNPWPGVFTVFRDQRLKIISAKMLTRHFDRPPGEVVDFTEEGIIVATGEGSILLSIIQPAGKNQMPAKDFKNGYQVKKGELLGKENG